RPESRRLDKAGRKQARRTGERTPENVRRVEKENYRAAGAGKPAYTRDGRDATRIPSARRCFLRRCRQSPAQRRFVGQRRRPVQAAACGETKNSGYCQRRTARSAGAGAQGGSSFF